MRKAKWLIYTVLIGLIPFFVRLLFFIGFKNLSPVYLLNEIDFAAFGLVLYVTNLNELQENYTGSQDWKNINIGLCIFALVIYSIVLAVAYFTEIDTKELYTNRLKIKYCSLVLSALSLVYSYFICGVLTDQKA